jgi:hypothetical protein
MLVGFSRQLQIRIAKAPQSFETQAKFIDMKLGLGMGLAFVSSTKEQKKVLGNWIVELGGKLPQPPQGRADTAKDRNTVSGEVPNVITALIQALTRKGVLTEAEAQEMLRKLGR